MNLYCAVLLGVKVWSFLEDQNSAGSQTTNRHLQLPTTFQRDSPLSREIARQLNKYAILKSQRLNCLQVKLSENTRKYCMTDLRTLLLEIDGKWVTGSTFPLHNT